MKKVLRDLLNSNFFIVYSFGLKSIFKVKNTIKNKESKLELVYLR